MFDIIKVIDNTYTIVYQNGVDFELNKAQVFETLIKYGVEAEEVLVALDAFDKGDNSAHFGIAKTFIYSYKLAS